MSNVAVMEKVTAKESVTNRMRKVPSDKPFLIGMSFIFAMYILLILGASCRCELHEFCGYRKNITKPQYSVLPKDNYAELFYCDNTSVIVAVPTGYLLARFRFPGKQLWMPCWTFLSSFLL